MGKSDAAFVRNQFNLMAHWGEDLYAHDLEELCSILLLKNRKDGRPEMVMGLLRAAGIIEGSFERSDIRILRPLEQEEEHELVKQGKRDRDLRRLLETIEYAGTTECRKREIHRCVGLEWGGLRELRRLRRPAAGTREFQSARGASGAATGSS